MRNRLDSTAIVHCSLMNENWINAYRITATLTEQVNPDLLQQAVDSLIERYPTICSRIVKGAFWYYTEQLQSMKVRPLDCGLLESINCRNVFDRAINIMYDGDKVVLEAFHSVTDGHGAFTYLNSLLGIYSELKDGSLQPAWNKGVAVSEEFEDAFLKYGTGKAVKEVFAPVDNPFFFENRRDVLGATIFRMKTAEIRQMAKDIGCSMNDLLIASFFKAVFRLDGTAGKSVALTVPVNLRRYFASPTLLNFSYLSTATMEHGRRNLSVQEMATDIREQLKKQNNEKLLRKAMAKIAGITGNPLMKYVPVAVKDLAIRLAMKFGVEKTCMTITNLGNVAAMLPDGKKYLKGIDVLLSPRRTSPYNCGIVSYNEDLHIILTHMTHGSPLEQALSAQFTEMGIGFDCIAYT